VGREFGDRSGEPAAEGLPPFEAIGAGRGGEHHQAAAEHLVEFDGVGHGVPRFEGREVVVGGITAQAEIVHERANLFGIGNFPIAIGRVELDDRVADLGDGPESFRQVGGELAAHRIQFKSNGIFSGLGGQFGGLGLRGVTEGRDSQNGGHRAGDGEELPP